MKTCGRSLTRFVISGLIAFLILLPILAGQTHSVSANSGANPVVALALDSTLPPDESTPTPQPDETAFISPDSISITLIFETIFKWLFGKDLVQIFTEIDLSEEQKEQIGLLTGETNPIHLVNNFCEQVRSGDFTRMADSVRESNRDDGSGALSPAILMDFFEQLGAFCPAR
jgi:hypothetical protein